MSDKKIIIIEIAYGSLKEQLLLSIKTHEGMTVEDAIKVSGMLSRFPEINLNDNRVGIFGKLTKLDNTLKHLDRVEIYTSLHADPKEIRNQRAIRGKNKI